MSAKKSVQKMASLIADVPLTNEELSHLINKRWRRTTIRLTTLLYAINCSVVVCSFANFNIYKQL